MTQELEAEEVQDGSHGHGSSQIYAARDLLLDKVAVQAAHGEHESAL